MSLQSIIVNLFNSPDLLLTISVSCNFSPTRNWCQKYQFTEKPHFTFHVFSCILFPIVCFHVGNQAGNSIEKYFLWCCQIFFFTWNNWSDHKRISTSHTRGLVTKLGTRPCHLVGSHTDCIILRHLKCNYIHPKQEVFKEENVRKWSRWYLGQLK